MPDDPTSPDPFDLLGLPPSFDLNAGQIARAHRKASASAHPDRNPSAPDAGSEAARTTARLNHARRTLENDELRANALLERLGGPPKNREKALPDGFLIEIMRTRLAVEEALGSGDPAARETCESEAEAEREKWIHDVRAAFAALGDPPDPAQLTAIRVKLNAWRYIERLIEQLDPDYDPARADFDA